MKIDEIESKKTTNNILLFQFFRFHRPDKPNTMEMYAYERRVVLVERDDHAIRKVWQRQERFYSTDWPEFVKNYFEERDL